MSEACVALTPETEDISKLGRDIDLPRHQLPFELRDHLFQRVPVVVAIVDARLTHGHAAESAFPVDAELLKPLELAAARAVLALNGRRRVHARPHTQVSNTSAPTGMP